MKVALTFDFEAPGREHRLEAAPGLILDTLAEHGVRATFFVQGRWANCEPILARRIVDDGHLIGNHSHHHAPLTRFKDPSRDIVQAHETIKHVTGVNPKPWFRCPFGDVNESVEGFLQAIGYVHVGWDFHVADWEPATTVHDIVRGVVSGVEERGPNVLLHTWPATTAAALPMILAELAGAEFVTIDQL